VIGLNLQPFYDLQPQLHIGALPGADMFGAGRRLRRRRGRTARRHGYPEQTSLLAATPEEAWLQVREGAAAPRLDSKSGLTICVAPCQTDESGNLQRPSSTKRTADGLRVRGAVYYLDDAERLVNDGIDVLAARRPRQTRRCQS